ncbi:GAF domain-containing protein [Streptosporangiaceae bacterium NEAU-GS5]|nr:GAF domain-containing protein [Streptosporangiaceae bacterium NEAU-GS5]
MTDNTTLAAAMSLAVLDSEQDQRTLLHSVVLAARAIFDAAASSIFLLDTVTGDLVFEAVAGEGEEFLVGRRFPATRGIAGWVLSSGQPLVVDDLDGDGRFAKDIAESTRYVPRMLMATPVTCDEEPIGVLEVLDAGQQARSRLGQLELLSLFATQAAAALRIVQRSRAARARLLSVDAAGESSGHAAELGDLMEVARLLDVADAERRQAGLRLLGSVRTLLAG